MKWDEYQQKLFVQDLNRERTEIECPNCGAYLWRRTDIVLTSYPPQFRYECDQCGWEGCGH